MVAAKLRTGHLHRWRFQHAYKQADHPGKVGHVSYCLRGSFSDSDGSGNPLCERDGEGRNPGPGTESVAESKPESVAESESVSKPESVAESKPESVA